MGKKLGLFTINALELLEARNVAVVSGGEIHQVDLIDCVAILSKSNEKASYDLDADSLWKGLCRKKITRILNDPYYFQTEGLKFAQWLNDNWKPPSIRWKESGTSEAVAPYTDHLRLMLCKERICENVIDAGNFPVSDALWLAEASYERESGESRMESETDKQADQVLKDIAEGVYDG